MFFTHIVSALAGLSLAAAVPASVERDAAGVLHRREAHDKRDVIIQQTVIEPQVVVVNQNLGALNALALQAEQEFAALVQSQLTLINTVETIKNNIRINHFKTRWNTVNTVIVTVTNVVDARDPANINNRYMVNQVRADNGNNASEILVMMTADSALTIQPQATPTNLNIPGISGAGQAISQPTAQPQVAQFDPAAAFAQAANGAVLLPFNSTAPQPPSGAQLFPDPASIILPNQALFVGDVNVIQQDAALLAAGSLFNLQAQLLAQQAIAQAELAGVVLGTAPPPTIIINNNGNNGQQNNGQQNNGQQNNGQQNNGQQNNGQQNKGQ
ncbi:hypothetical protein N0V93_005554 [Gnomoniopsis smithogilvyi]|uniref:Uncharacterized protein n=1 Tax=Gnomoniopsis smithogilvyi TaxID=1191159 RepID=A0A9W8YWU7_9PEZI|nr:hypothetical protein N0V93_005554 [Gnomoniopsis smithogilvyi]